MSMPYEKDCFIVSNGHSDVLCGDGESAAAGWRHHFRRGFDFLLLYLQLA